MSLQAQPIWAGLAHDRNSATSSSTHMGGGLSHGQPPQSHSDMQMMAAQGSNVVTNTNDGIPPDGDMMPPRQSAGQAPVPIPLPDAHSPHVLQPALGMPTHPIPMHDIAGIIPRQGQMVEYGHAPGLSSELSDMMDAELPREQHPGVPPILHARGGSPRRASPEGQSGGSINATQIASRPVNAHEIAQPGNDPRSFSARTQIVTHEWLRGDTSDRYGAYRSPSKNEVRRTNETLAAENAHLKNVIFPQMKKAAEDMVNEGHQKWHTAKDSILQHCKDVTARHLAEQEVILTRRFYHELQQQKEVNARTEKRLQNSSETVQKVRAQMAEEIAAERTRLAAQYEHQLADQQKELEEHINN